MQHWVIYKDPKFSPHPFTALNINGDGFTGQRIDATTLAGVHAKLPPGFKPNFVSQMDDPVVIEIWQRRD